MRVNPAARPDRPLRRTPPPADLLAALPVADQQRLWELGRDAHDLFGRLRDAQDIVDAHLGFLDYLLANGADHGMLGRLLAQVGIVRPNGTPLPVGTLSSALSRARGRDPAAPARPGRDQPERTGAGLILPAAAAPCSTLHDPASQCSRLPEPAITSRERQDAAEPGIALQDPAAQGIDIQESDGAGRRRPNAARHSMPLPPADPRRARDDTDPPPAPSAIPIATAPPTAGAPSPTLARPTAPPAASTENPPNGADAALATERAAHLLNKLRFHHE